MNQRTYLESAQQTLEVGPVEMARLLDTNWNTYKSWLYERNPLPGIAKVAIERATAKDRWDAWWEMRDQFECSKGPFTNEQVLKIMDSYETIGMAEYRQARG